MIEPSPAVRGYANVLDMHNRKSDTFIYAIRGGISGYHCLTVYFPTPSSYKNTSLLLFPFHGVTFPTTLYQLANGKYDCIYICIGTF